MFDDDRTALSTYHRNGMWGSVYWFRNVFDIEELYGNRKKIIGKFSDYNCQVEDFFRSRNKPLHVFDISKEAEPWDGLCAFLGRKKPFPRLNAAPMDRDNMQSVLRKKVAEVLDLDDLLGGD